MEIARWQFSIYWAIPSTIFSKKVGLTGVRAHTFISEDLEAVISAFTDASVGAGGWLEFWRSERDMQICNFYSQKFKYPSTYITIII